MLPLALVVLIAYFLFSNNSTPDSNTDSSENSNHNSLSLDDPEDFFILGMFFDDDEFF